MFYLFVHDGTRFLFFTTEGGHKTGSSLKNYFYVQPKEVEAMQAYIAEHKPKVGDMFQIGRATYIVSRKHYGNKHNLPAVKKALLELKEKHKVAKDDFAELIDLMKSLPIDIKYCCTSDPYKFRFSGFKKD
jgi:hypothetical protein